MTEAQICLLMSEDLNRNETSTVVSIQCYNKPWRLLGKYSASPAYEFLNSFLFFRYNIIKWVWFQILLNGYIIYIISSSFQTLAIFPKCFPLFDFHDQYFE